jgi:hypothetical protein
LWIVIAWFMAAPRRGAGAEDGRRRATAAATLRAALSPAAEQRRPFASRGEANGQPFGLLQTRKRLKRNLQAKRSKLKRKARFLPEAKMRPKHH